LASTISNIEAQQPTISALAAICERTWQPDLIEVVPPVVIRRMSTAFARSMMDRKD
jgi:hypothetical protein